jgi:hypothetical protein
MEQNSNAIQILITKDEAHQIINFFWPNQVYISAVDFTEADIRFAQFLIKEALESSYKLGFVEILFKAVYWKVPVDFSAIEKIVKEICKEFTKHIFKHYVEKSGEVKIYDAIRNTIAMKFKPSWGIRVNTGELIY